jgi:hypothetical protein
MSDETISPLRRRMIEDMTVRGCGAKTRHDYVRQIPIDHNAAPGPAGSFPGVLSDAHFAAAHCISTGGHPKPFTAADILRQADGVAPGLEVDNVETSRRPQPARHGGHS